MKCEARAGASDIRRDIRLLADLTAVICTEYPLIEPPEPSFSVICSHSSVSSIFEQVYHFIFNVHCELL